MSGNVDLAPTVASLLGLHFDAPSGRVLSEALVGQSSDYRVATLEQSSDSVHLPKTCRPDDPGCAHPSPPMEYRVTLRKKVLTAAGDQRSFSYFDRASVMRESARTP